ncbi:hypothetical protein H671_3g9978, partial [Cricetulus griseus]
RRMDSVFISILLAYIFLWIWCFDCYVSGSFYVFDVIAFAYKSLILGYTLSYEPLKQIEILVPVLNKLIAKNINIKDASFGLSETSCMMLKTGRLDMKNHHSQEQKWVSLVLEGNCRDDITLDIIHELPSRLLFLWESVKGDLKNHSRKTRFCKQEGSGCYVASS